MKSLIVGSVTVLISVTNPLFGDPAPQPQISFTEGASGTWNADWSGVYGRTYFFQCSQDLAGWSYAPLMEFGTGVKSAGIETENAPKLFVRLHYVDDPAVTSLSQARQADFDNDGIPNYYEVENLTTNPLDKFSAGGDSDLDGLPDGWEKYHFGNLSKNGFQNSDGDNYNNFEELALRTDPKVSNSTLVDTDGDRMPNAYETAHGLSTTLDDSLEDADGDRVPNIFEYKNGTSASDPGSTPRVDFIVDATEGPLDPDDDVFKSVQEALDRAMYAPWDDVLNQPGTSWPYRIIEVKAGIYRENVNIASIPILLMGETGATVGPVVVSGRDEGATVHIESASVLDGMVVTHPPGIQGRGIETVYFDDPWDPQPQTFKRRRLVNCLVKGNTGVEAGGIYSEGGLLSVVHSTITGNSSSEQGQGITQVGGSLSLFNTIVWGNSVSVPLPGSTQLSTGGGATLNISQTAPSIIGDENTLAIPGWIDNFDPRLTPSGWLKSDSPAINAGGGVLGTGSLRDIHGEQRNQDSGPDIGADEYRDSNSISDGDGVPDWAEGTDDNDGLNPLEEYEVHGTEPRIADTDGDGMSDGDEVTHGFNPLIDEDNDGDGMSDAWEYRNGLDWSADDSLADQDGDRVPNVFEYHHGTAANLLAEVPQITFEVNPTTGNNDSEDNIYPTINSALSAVAARDEDGDYSPDPFPIILVRGALYAEKVELSDIPILLLGELGGAAGPVKILSNQSNATLSISSASVVDGFIIGHQFQSGSGVSVSANSWDAQKRRRMVNCIVRNNNAFTSGGISASGCDLDLIHCTVFANTASFSPAGVGLISSHLHLLNSVIYGNSVSSNQQISIGSGSSVTTLPTAPSIIGDANTSSQPGWIVANPGLLASGYIENQFSGAVDTGGVLTSSKVIFDIDGQLRTAGGTPDIGADEFVPPTDTDSDGMPDAWENQYGLSPTDDSDALADQDGDRIPNLWEYQRGTSPIDNASRPLADWIVDPLTAGTGNHVATIQQAVNNAPVLGANPALYSVIEVRHGIFTENVILPANKRIVLLGETGYPITEIRSPLDEVATLQIYGEAFVDGFRVTRSKQPGGILLNDARGITVSLPVAAQASLSNLLINGHSTGSGSGVSLLAGRLHLLHTTIYDTTAQVQGHAISLGSGTRMDIVNSIIRGNADPSCQQIFVSPTAVLSVAGSFVRNGELGANASDPLLTPVGWLRRTSPAINFGIPSHVQRDIHSETRSGNPDAGVDEFIDGDDDGLPNWLEALGVTSPGGDDDTDGTSNLVEYEIQGTNPLSDDSDGDGMDDGYEFDNGLDPLVDDSFEDADGDRVPNVFEHHYATQANDVSNYPLPTFEVNLATGDSDPDDAIFPSITSALAAVALRDEDTDSQPDPYAMILVRSGEYQENVVLSGVPILLLGELAGPDGPVRISPGATGAAVTMQSPSVVDGFVISHRDSVSGRGVEASAMIAESNRKRRLINCIVRDNSADTAAGISATDCDLTLIHCTVIGNYSVTSAPGVGLYGAALHMFNSVIAGNHAPYGIAINQIEVGAGSSVSASGSAPSLVGDYPLAPISGWIRMDPLLATDGFADAYSKVLDTGGNMATTKVLFDIQGQQRPEGNAVDIGADEFVPTYPSDEDDGSGVNPNIIDSDGDGIPDQWEIANSLDPEVPNSATDLQTYLDSRDTTGELEVHTPLLITPDS